MFDRIINILVIEQDEQDAQSLLSVIHNPGHNVFWAQSESEVYELLKEKSFALIFCSIDLPNLDTKRFIHNLNPSTVGSLNKEKNATVIVTSSITEKVYSIVGEMGFQGAVDYLLKPFIPNLIKAKIAVYKKLYFKHQRVSRLLESILPAQTLTEFSLYGKSSPKKKRNSIVMFTDFVNFTQKTKNADPQDIVKKLDHYFTRFDEIILKYKLEKIKTIGDAYMVVGGVTEKDPYPAIRMALAALEIRNFIYTDSLTQKALGRETWDIRIGIHSGDLVAGVVGSHKFSFDVWGDTVNIAARCEQNSTANAISISATYAQQLTPFFDMTTRGEIVIKNGGQIGMFYLDQIKSEYSLYGDGRIPNIDLRKAVGLPLADFEGMRSFILNKLKAELSENLHYHSLEHTVNVENAVIKYAELEGLSAHELFLVRTAALFHDSGFLFRYEDNESLAVELLRHYAPQYGYSEKDLKIIEKIIMATVQKHNPENLMEAIMCDADLDYLGRLDYHVTAAKLFHEMELYGKKLSPVEKIKMQIAYLEEHHSYHTISAKNLRRPGKLKRIEELKRVLKELTEQA